MGLPAHLEGLLRPAAYPHPADDVQLIETPLSWVLIAGERAYKIKRPVHFAFVEQAGLDDRLLLCCDELRLNRRFAPQLYLAVAAITVTDGHARIGGSGQPVEYAVVMHAFDADAALDRLVAAGRAAPAELDAFGRWLAQVQAALPSQTGLAANQAAQRTAAAAARNARECVATAGVSGNGACIVAIADQLAAEFRRRDTPLARRAAAGRVRECHGDLHLSNVVRLDGRLVPFDCLEFDPALRWIDVAQDVAFLYADLVAYGAPDLAATFLNAWLQAGGDYDACTVLRAYSADRALVRAKVMALRGDTPLLRERHAHYLGVAAAMLRPPQPRCVMMCGLPGSGKSWLARRLAAALPALHLQSDVERRRLGEPYTAQGKARVYARLADCAAVALDGRFDVIVDANFGRRAERAGLAAVCRAAGAPLVVVECSAPAPVLRARIAARRSAAQDPSDADLEVLGHQAAMREPLAADEGLTVLAADTACDNVVQRLLAQLHHDLPREPPCR